MLYNCICYHNIAEAEVKRPQVIFNNTWKKFITRFELVSISQWGTPYRFIYFKIITPSGQVFSSQATNHSWSQVLPLIFEVHLQVKAPEELYGYLLCFALLFFSILVPKPETRSTTTKTKEGWFSLTLAGHSENNNWESTFQDKLFSQIFYVAFWTKIWYSGGIQHFNRTGVDATASQIETVPMCSHLCIWRSIFIKLVK